MIDKLGGRKTVVAMICLIAGVAIDLTTERGLSQNLLALMMFIVGAYSTANVLNKKVVGGQHQEDQGESKSNVAAEEILMLKQNQAQVEQYLSGLLTTIEGLQQQVDLSNKRVAALLQQAPKV